MTWKGWARWMVLVGALAMTFGRWCLRSIVRGDPPTTRLTLAPRHRESSEGREDRIQPRSLAIRVSAPEDARSVTVTLPSGETRRARYDPDRRVWTLRFFLDPGRPEGTSDVGVSVVDANGRTEALRLPLAAGSHGPAVHVVIDRSGDPRDDLQITAQLTVVAEGMTASGTLASVAEDARHVEVSMPDGRLVILGLVGDGVFRGYWRPRRPLSGPLRVRVVSVDRALNERVSELSVAPPLAVTADGGPLLGVAGQR